MDDEFDVDEVDVSVDEEDPVDVVEAGGGVGADTAVEPAVRLAVRTDGNADSSITAASTHNIRIQWANMVSALDFVCELLNVNAYE